MTCKKIWQTFILLVLVKSSAFCQDQQVFPVFYTPLAFPLNKVYFFPEVKMVATGNDIQLQLWDATSQAYYGTVAIFTPENIMARIRHVEYLSDKKQIAIIGEQLMFGPSYTTSYSDYLYIYDLLTLALVKPPQVNGMAALIDYKYKNKTVLPELKDAAEIFQYHYSERLDQLYTVDRAGNVNIYKNGAFVKDISTNVQQSRLLVADPTDKKLFLADNINATLKTIDLNTSAVTKSISLLSYAACRNNESMYSDYKNYCVRYLAESAEFILLDSINRFRIFDTKSNAIKTIPANFGSIRITSIDWAVDSSATLIGESPEFGCRMMAFKLNLHTKVYNAFGEKGLGVGFIGSLHHDGSSSNFSLAVAGYGEYNTDIEKLQDYELLQLPVQVGDLSMLEMFAWEKGFVTTHSSESNEFFIKVYLSESVRSRLLYKQKIRLVNNEALAGIEYHNKWYVTTSNLKAYKPELSNMTVKVYDSTGKVLFSQAGNLPLQMLNTAYTGQQFFSADGKHLLIREFKGRFNSIDSFRLRVYKTAGFSLEADIRYAEAADVETLMKKNVAFSTDNQHFYYTALAQNNKLTYFYKYRLNTGAATKVSETLLCVDGQCANTVSVRRIALTHNDSVLTYTGFARSPFPQQQAYAGVQVIRNMNLFNQQIGWFFDLPIYLSVRKVLAFKNFIGFQYDNYIDFYKQGNRGAEKFLSISPVTNEQTGMVSNFYVSATTNDPVPIYYEKTGNSGIVSFKYGTHSVKRNYFDLTFNRPDRIMERIPNADPMQKELFRQVILKRSEKLNSSTSKVISGDIPELKFVNAHAANNILNINVAAKSRAALKYLNVTINGNRRESDIAGNEIQRLPKKAGDEWTYYNFNQIMTGGENKVEISVSDDNRRESLPVGITQNSLPDVDKPVLYMLVAAVENYNDVSRNLSYTIKNGRDIANVFEHHLSDTLFQRVKIDTLFDKMVSSRAVADWINTLHNLRPQDYVIVFYNGHGFLNDNFDLQLTEPRTNFVSKTGTIDFNAVLEKIDLLPARQKLLIIDACYSGDIDKKDAGFLQDGKHVFESLQSLFSFSQQGNGTLVFASANGNKRSIGALESNKPNNDYFTTAFKEYFLNKDLRPDAFGRIWVNDLVRYVTVRTHALSGNDQLPNLRINNPDNNFRIR